MFPIGTDMLTSMEPLATCTYQLVNCEDHVLAVHNHVLRSRLVSIAGLMPQLALIIHDHTFQPGTLVLIQKKTEPTSDAMHKPHYFGSMAVISHSPNDSCRPAEVDRSLSHS